jgi:hypothetical protein
MNQEIKFRLWDEEQKEFSYGRDFLLSLDGEVLFNNGFGGKSKCDYNCRDQVVQQYTNFRDLHDKEIYDGDLIMGNIMVGAKQGFGPYRVFWDDKKGGWCSCCYSDSELISTYKTIEVVGHIFDGTEYQGVK